MVGLVKLVLQSGKALSLSSTSQVCHSMARDFATWRQAIGMACLYTCSLDDIQSAMPESLAQQGAWWAMVGQHGPRVRGSLCAAGAEATRAHMQGEIEKLRTEMEVSAAVT